MKLESTASWQSVEDVEDLNALARRVLPAGSLGNVENDLIISHGQGGRVWDQQGREYLDFLIGSGPMLLGHAHPEVNEAVQSQLSRGSTFFMTNEPIIRLAEEIVNALPCADQVRFVTSGSEAAFYALRAARAFRGRDKILKFEGGYHGMSDYALMSMAPKTVSNFPTATPDTAGVPRSLTDEVLIAPYNDVEAVASLLAEHHNDLAAIIVEPVQRQIPPLPGFLQGLRDLATKYGIPLIFDEVVTGFRMAYGGAQAHYGVTPDLCSIGKIIGGGFPLAAVAGRSDIMAHFSRQAAPRGAFLPQLGTLAGNPVAAVAGLKTMEILRRPGAYERINALGTRLMKGLETAVAKAGIPARVVGVPSVFDVIYTDKQVIDWATFSTNDKTLQKKINAGIRQAGIIKPDAKYYPCLAHTEADIDQVIDVFTHLVNAI